jgi:hypothetical protein
MTLYTDAFYDRQSAGSLRSAKTVVPFIVAMYDPKTIADIGGGIGTWSKACEEFGIDATCFDGDYVDQKRVLCKKFVPKNLEQPLNIAQRFDAVICLEVAEHLPETRAASFVQDLCGLADVIVFSAAIPGQGGVNHINEQPHEYWHRLFEANGFAVHDSLRRAVGSMPQVEWWYRQNLFTYTKKRV